MSVIVKELWNELDQRRTEYESLFLTNKFEAYSLINNIASEIGKKYGVVLQINIPPGQSFTSKIGRNGLTILVERNRENFLHVSTDQVEQALERLQPLKIEPIRAGDIGFRVQLPTGQLHCLPSGIHLWCEITPSILKFLDWIFQNEYLR
jgi:hypothetical protein